MKIQALLTEKGKMDKWGNISTETCYTEIDITEEQRKKIEESMLKYRDYYLSVNHENPS